MWDIWVGAAIVTYLAFTFWCFVFVWADETPRPRQTRFQRVQRAWGWVHFVLLLATAGLYLLYTVGRLVNEQVGLAILW